MNSSGLVRELRLALADVRAVCSALGLTTAPRASQRQALVLCPWHAERTPSCSVRLAKDGTLAVRCHACGASGDALTLIAQVRGLDLRSQFREVLAAAAEIANAPAVVQSLEHRAQPEPQPEGVSDETYDAIWSHILGACAPTRDVAPSVAGYLRWRRLEADAEAVGVGGLPKDARSLVRGLLAVFERRDLELAGVLRHGRDEIDRAGWALLIPWRDRFGRIQCIQRRRLDDGTPKYRSPRGRCPRSPFGVHLLADAIATTPGAEVIVVEGALDALARRAIARERGEAAAVLGVYSAASPCEGLPMDLLRGRRVVLALDDDAAGDRAVDKLVDALSDVAGEMVRERPVGAKDWAEALAGRAA